MVDVLIFNDNNHKNIPVPCKRNISFQMPSDDFPLTSQVLQSLVQMVVQEITEALYFRVLSLVKYTLVSRSCHGLCGVLT